MTLDVTKALERRRMRRRVTFWRVLAIVAVIAGVVIAGAGRLTDGGYFAASHIARVDISGLIQSDRQQLKLLEDLAEDEHVAAVLLSVNSPGGTTAGGEALYEKIRDLSERKPVVAVFDTMATSAAYIVGLASDRIVARGNTITGSVGVIFQWAEVTGLLDKLGVRMNEVKSGTLKAEPSMFSPLTPEGRALTEEMVEEAQVWFNGLVAERRKLDPQNVPGLTEGRIYSGRQALGFGLIDAIGGEPEAIAWLEKERGIAADLSVRLRKPKSDAVPGLLSFAVHGLLDAAGFGDAGRRIFASLGLSMTGKGHALELDGLVSVWHASAN